MTWVAVAVGGAALVGAGASYLGSKKQADAATNAANISQNQFGVTNAQQQPYIQSGYGALSRLNTLLGLSPNPNAQYSKDAVLPPQTPLYPGYDPTNPPRPIMTGDKTINSNPQLRQLLSIRADNGDPQAAQLLKMVM